MKDEKRIIGEFMEISADILQNQLNSKLPAFLAKIISKHQRKKLIKSCKKFRNSNYILDKYNISELIYYVYNNYPPKGEYGSICFAKIDPETTDRVECVVMHGDKERIVKAIITIDLKLPTFELTIYDEYDDKNNNYYIEVEKLSTPGKKTEEPVVYINNILRNTMCDYINGIITKYL